MDSTTYDKASKHPSRWGYQSRGGVVPSSIVIHTTNNRRPTRFETEAKYLMDSAAVSAHFLIGKDGRVVQFLDPLKYQAWHAGNCVPAYLNSRSIGIEHHVSIGEAWTPAQHAACTELVQSLMRAYGISPLSVETHRAVALPHGRKSDPEGWDDTAFYVWRAALAPVSPPPTPKRYRVLGVPVYQRSDRAGPLWGHLGPGETIVIDDASNGHLADGRGFVKIDPDVLEAI